MFLTTEPNFVNDSYQSLGVVHSTSVVYPNAGKFFANVDNMAENFSQAIEYAMNSLRRYATSLGADAVIGVQLTTTPFGDSNVMITAITVMGTAIKFN